MKIKYGNILDEKRGILVHGVNAQGVMGAGIAKQIKTRYPNVQRDYLTRFSNNGHRLELGEVIITDISPTLVIVSGVTQEDYGRDPRIVYVNYNAIAEVFSKVKKIAMETKLPIIFPLIGCGLANGNKDVILEIIEKTLGNEVPYSLFLID